ncbi:MAG TPA: glycosyltransferase family 2 protein, partial [Candidatus Eremiobacteraceae bacterium]|nr:glycosyltransferase family 2 protein [Candidatus Eremiobacteraceae bacterium]
MSLVVPAFNEAGIIERNLDELLNYLTGLQAAYRFELVLVDDGSSDQTGTVADAFAAARSGVHVCHHGRNRGLGAALKTGFARAGGDYIVTLDLDLSYEPAYVAALLDAL